jgi:carnitine monooxygenase subunit
MSLVWSFAARNDTDPTVFETEQAGFFARSRLFACHAGGLHEAGDYVGFDLAGENLFAIMGRDGVIRAFYTLCQHRAHRLVKGPGACGWWSAPIMHGAMR